MHVMTVTPMLVDCGDANGVGVGVDCDRDGGSGGDCDGDGEESVGDVNSVCSGQML